MMVEDEISLLLVISKALRKRGFSVIAAGDGHTALELFQRHLTEIDAVLLDITLPGLAGLDVLTALRKLKPDVKVILTSAYTKSAVGGSSGKQTEVFIRKPYHMDELLRLLHSIGVEQ